MVEGCLPHFTPVHNLHTTVITNKVDTSMSPLDPQNLGALSASALLAPKNSNRSRHDVLLELCRDWKAPVTPVVREIVTWCFVDPLLKV